MRHINNCKNNLNSNKNKLNGKKKSFFKPMPNLNETLLICWVEFGNKTQLQSKAITPFNIFVLDVILANSPLYYIFFLYLLLQKFQKKKINNYYQFNV